MRSLHRGRTTHSRFTTHRQPNTTRLLNSRSLRVYDHHDHDNENVKVPRIETRNVRSLDALRELGDSQEIPPFFAHLLGAIDRFDLAVSRPLSAAASIEAEVLNGTWKFPEAQP